MRELVNDGEESGFACVPGGIVDPELERVWDRREIGSDGERKRREEEEKRASYFDFPCSPDIGGTREGFDLVYLTLVHQSIVDVGRGSVSA